MDQSKGSLQRQQQLIGKTSLLYPPEGEGLLPSHLKETRREPTTAGSVWPPCQPHSPLKGEWVPPYQERHEDPLPT